MTAATDARGEGAFASRIEETVVDGWFRDPPALVAAMATAPTRAVAKAFVLEWTKFSRLFPRWVGAIVANCPEFDVIAFEIENLVSEVVRDPAAATNHYELLVRLGVGAGLDRATIEAHEPAPQTLDAFGWWWQMARNPDWLLGFTAINGLEVLGDRALPRRYGLARGTGLDPHPWAATGIDEHALEFFRVSYEADAGHGRETVEIIARSTSPAQEEQVLDVLAQTMARLRRMMDGMWRLATRLDDDRPDEESRDGSR